MFEISQIRCFVAVAEELHFNRAAERLNMTQSPLSRQIRLLEHHVGTQLLDRTSRTVRLTAAGRAFFPEAARILRMAEEAAATARRVAKGENGTLAIGFTATFGYGMLPELVRRLRDRSPGISLTLKELVTNAQLEALDAGQLDLGLMRPHAEHGELATVDLGSEAFLPVRLVLVQDHVSKSNGDIVELGEQIVGHLDLWHPVMHDLLGACIDPAKHHDSEGDNEKQKWLIKSASSI